MNTARDVGGSVQLARRWLQVLAGQQFDAWPQLIAPDVQMRFPFSPPGIPSECHGLGECREMIRAFFAAIETFDWQDLQLHAAADPGLVFATVRSSVQLRNGRSYANQYVMMLRFRDGLLAEYREYFNPLPAIAAFS